MLDELTLPTRVHNALRRYGVRSLRQLATMPVDDIASLPHCGSTCLRQLIAALKNHAIERGDYDKLLSVLGTTPVHTLRLPNALVNRLGSIRVLTLP